jgi:putative addiction module killer protein
MYDIQDYVTPDGRNLFRQWLKRLKDSKTKQSVERRLTRAADGNFGDHKFCRDGVWELRIDVGPGLRVYYALSGPAIVLLLCGGDKSSQRADIERACECWKQLKGEQDDANGQSR